MTNHTTSTNIDQAASRDASPQNAYSRPPARRFRSGGKSPGSTLTPGDRTPGTPSRRAKGLKFAKAGVKTPLLRTCADFSTMATCIRFTRVNCVYDIDLLRFLVGNFKQVLPMSLRIVRRLWTTSILSTYSENFVNGICMPIFIAFLLTIVGSVNNISVEGSTLPTCLMVNMCVISTLVFLIKLIGHLCLNSYEVVRERAFGIVGAVNKFTILLIVLLLPLAVVILSAFIMCLEKKLLLTVLLPYIGHVVAVLAASTRFSTSDHHLFLKNTLIECVNNLTEPELLLMHKYAIYLGRVRKIDDTTYQYMNPQGEILMGSYLPPQSQSRLDNILSRVSNPWSSANYGEYMQNLAYDLGKLLFSLTRSKGDLDVVIIALINFLDNRAGQRVLIHEETRNRFLLALERIARDLGANVLEGFKDTTPDPHPNDLPEQKIDLEQVADYGKLLVDSYHELMETPIFLKVYKLFSYTLAFGIFRDFGLSFETFGYSRLQAELMKKKYYKRSEFAIALIDTSQFILRQGIQSAKTGTLAPLFHSGATYVQWYDQVRKLKDQSKFLDNPEIAGFSLFSYEGELDEAIEKGESIVKYGAEYASKVEAQTLKHFYRDLQFLKAELATTKRANMTRKPPFSVMLHGDSGVGKSYLKDLLYYYHASLRGLPNGDEYKFTRSPASEFWDGFRSSVHTLIMDDVAYIKPDATNDVDTSLKELIQVINPTPMMPNQAALEKKGKTPFLAELVIATTNIKDLNSFHYFSHPSAIQRRLPFIITPRVRPEFAKPGGSLDTSKVLLREDFDLSCVDDYWLFDIEEVLPRKYTKNGGNMAEIRKIHKDLSTGEFLQWFGGAVTAHHKQQDKMSASVDRLKGIEVCNLCYSLNHLCKCQKQSLDLVARVASRKTSLPAIMAIVTWTLGIYEYLIGIGFWLSMLVAFVPFLTDDTVYNATMYLLRLFFLKKVNNTREDIRILGDRIRDRIGYPRLLVGAVGTTMLMGIMYKVFRSSVNQQSERRPIADNEKINPWKKDDYETTTFDINRGTLSWKNQDRAFVKAKLQHNVTKIDIRGDTEQFRTNMFGLCGHWYIINTHAIPKSGDLSIQIIRGIQADGVNLSKTIVRRQSDIYRIGKSDISLIYIRELPPVRDVRQLLARSSLRGTLKGYYLIRNTNGEYVYKDVHKATQQGWGLWRSRAGVYWQGYTETEPTKDGDCGAPLILETEYGPVIAGIHCAGDGDKIQCLVIPDEALDHIRKVDDVVDSGEPNISAPGFERTVEDLHYKSPIRYIEEGNATVYGSFTGFRPSPRSRVENTPMSEFLEEQGYSVKYTKPQMSGWKPWRIALEDMVNPIYKFDQSIVEEAKIGFLSDIIAALPEHEFDKLCVYDTFTAINGAASIAHVDRVNMSTSAGNPYKKSKKYFITPDPDSELPEAVNFLEPIKSRIAEMEQEYREGRRVQPNFCAHLKDEPVTFAKAELGKTRVFAGAPTDWIIVVRKFYLSFIRVMMRNKLVFESAPGVVVQSREWSELYHYLTRYGTETMVAGDYKAYDKRMSPVFMMAAFDIIIEICKLSRNFDDEEIQIMRGIATDTSYPLMDFNGDLIQFNGSNPSGHPLTVVINCLVNSLYMRYAYHVLNPKRECVTFQKNVSLLTYGDDNALGVHPDCPWYNHSSISLAFKQMDIIYTMADKSAESVPYLDISQISFLKRTWRFDSHVGDYLAPLDHESIEKSLMTWVRSKSICKEEQCIAIISSAVREYFFYGKKTFLKRRQMFVELIEKLNLQMYQTDSTLPTYEELLALYDGVGVAGELLVPTGPRPGDPGYDGAYLAALDAWSPSKQ
jgi:hypothetical protein